MTTTTILTNKRTQAVRLPADMRFPDSVKKVEVRILGQDRIITPANAAWDSFFLSSQFSATPDFLEERASQNHPENGSDVNLTLSSRA